MLKEFISGCCWPVFVPFFWGFNTLKSQYNIENMTKLIGNYDPYYEPPEDDEIQGTWACS